MQNKIIAFIRGYVERFPRVATAYRALRDEIDGLSPAKDTPWGFRLSGNTAMANGDFEPEETAVVREMLSDVDILINIGANIGYYCCHALSMGKHVIAFEPIQRNLRHLYRNVTANDWTDIEIYPVALSNQSGVMKIYGGNTGASVLKGWAGTSENYATYVPSMVLDSILVDRMRGKRVLVIVDVEGAEHMVLTGARRLIQNDPKPAWLVEISSTENQPSGTKVNPYLVETFNLMFANDYAAMTADALRRVVSLEDAKWASEQGVPVCGTHNFIFRAN